MAVFSYHWDDTSELYHSNDSLSTVIKKKKPYFFVYCVADFAAPLF